jgi:hypothetical protein
MATPRSRPIHQYAESTTDDLKLSGDVHGTKGNGSIELLQDGFQAYWRTSFSALRA